MKGLIVNKVTTPELTAARPELGASFAEASSDATRRFYEQGQTIAQTMTEWNAEVSHFLSDRVARNGDAIGRITKCQGLPEVFAVQAQCCCRLLEGDEQADGGQQQDHGLPDGFIRTTRDTFITSESMRAAK